MNIPRIPIATTLQFLHRYFIWLVVFSYVIAAIMPALGLWIRNIGFSGASMRQSNVAVSLPTLLLAALLFNAGLGVKTAELIRFCRRPFLLLSVLILNLLTPLSLIVAVSFLMSPWHNVNTPRPAPRPG